MRWPSRIWISNREEYKQAVLRYCAWRGAVAKANWVNVAARRVIYCPRCNTEHIAMPVSDLHPRDKSDPIAKRLCKNCYRTPVKCWRGGMVIGLLLEDLEKGNLSAWAMRKWNAEPPDPDRRVLFAEEQWHRKPGKAPLRWYPCLERYCGGVHQFPSERALEAHRRIMQH